MTDEDNFAAVVAGAVLRAGDEEIQAEVLNDLVANTGSGTTLEKAITDLRTMERRAGDFGMEIAGSMILPVLIAAASKLWSAYLSRLSEQAGVKLADYTLDQIKAIAKRIWRSDDTVVSVKEFELFVREAAGKEQLPPDQIDRLVKALHSLRMEDELSKI